MIIIIKNLKSSWVALGVKWPSYESIVYMWLWEEREWGVASNRKGWKWQGENKPCTHYRTLTIHHQSGISKQTIEHTQSVGERWKKVFDLTWCFVATSLFTLARPFSAVFFFLFFQVLVSSKLCWEFGYIFEDVLKIYLFLKNIKLIYFYYSSIML